MSLLKFGMAFANVVLNISYMPIKEKDYYMAVIAGGFLLDVKASLKNQIQCLGIWYKACADILCNHLPVTNFQLRA